MRMVFPTNAIQTCLTMKVLFGMLDIGAPLVRATMALRHTTGFVESLLRLIFCPAGDHRVICREGASTGRCRISAAFAAARRP